MKPTYEELERQCDELLTQRDDAIAQRDDLIEKLAELSLWNAKQSVLDMPFKRIDEGKA